MQRFLHEPERADVPAAFAHEARRLAGKVHDGGDLAVARARIDHEVQLVLENASGGGDLLGSRAEELAMILDGVNAPPARFGFCIDTAHLWGAGYDVSTAGGASGVLDRKSVV